MAKVIVVALEKGGVGKTTTTQHLGMGLAKLGRQVLLVDCDPQGSLSKRFDLSAAQYNMSHVLGVGGENEVRQSLRAAIIPTHQAGLFLAPCNERLAKTSSYLDREHALFRLDHLLRKEAGSFDYVILDTPPGRSMMQTAAMAAADELICPVECAPMGLEGWVQIDTTVQTVREHQQERGAVRLQYRAIVPTKYSRGEHVSDGIIEVLQRYEHPDYAGVPLPVSEPIPQTTHFEKCSTPRPIVDNGHDVRRALTIWEAGSEEIVKRAGDAYLALARLVDAYA